MLEYSVDEDLAALVEQLAKAKPFENLSFNAALRRILERYVDELDLLDAETAVIMKNAPKKTPSPSPIQWVDSVPELKNNKGLIKWKLICDFLGIETAGDSARRRLSNWVKLNRPTWPSVPELTDN